jgi:hypothetical protein
MLLREIHGNPDKTVAFSRRDDKPDVLIPEVEEEMYDLLWTVNTLPYRSVGLDIAKVARLWQEYFKTHVLHDFFTYQLFKFGSLQKLFAEDKTDITQGMKKLRITSGVPRRRGAKLPEDSATINIKKGLSTAEKNSRHLTERAVQVLRRARAPAAATNGGDAYWQDLISGVVDFLKGDYECFEEFVHLVAAIPTILMGEQGVIEGEELPLQAVVSRGDARSLVQTILEGVIHVDKYIRDHEQGRREIEEMANNLPVNLEGKPDDVTSIAEEMKDLLRYRSKSLPELKERLDGAVAVLVAMRLELAGVDGLLAVEKAWPMGRKKDGGLVAVYKTMLEDRP